MPDPHPPALAGVRRKAGADGTHRMNSTSHRQPTGFASLHTMNTSAAEAPARNAMAQQRMNRTFRPTTIRNMHFTERFSNRRADMMKIKTVARLAFGIAGLMHCAFASSADIRDQWNVQTGKAELVVPDLTPQNVAAQVNDALSQWAIPANSNLRSLPSVIPARPDQPEAVQRYVNGAPVIEYQCKTAFAEITKRPPPVNNPLMFVAEYHQACVYPFQKGVKIYLLFTSAKKTESLTGGLFNGIAKAIRGSDEERITKQLNEDISAIKKNIPSLLAEKIEVPGLPVQEPDKAAVAALIPARVEPVTTALPTAAAAAFPLPVAVPAQPASSMQSKIEARKSLNAMGMTYHSQEHFIAAIRRKDDVAVQLFLEAGGVDLTNKEKNGKTPLEVAQEVGAPAIIKMLSEPAGKDSAAPSPTPTMPAAAPGLTAKAAPTAERDFQAALALFSPQELAELNASIETMNLPPEQKELFRTQAILKISQLKAFANRIDPETGHLK